MIAPSILSSNFATLKDSFSSWQKNGVEILHFDVMDNHFVPNLTFGHKFIQDLREWTTLPFDVHLMITDPAQFVPLYVQAGANYISAHIEAFSSTQELHDTIEYLHQHQILFGLALKPQNNLSMIQEFLPYLDYVLVMTVEPGFGGQTLIPQTLNKIQQLNSYRQTHQLHFKIEADGGINPDNMTHLVDLGTDILVMGSAFFKSNNPFEILNQYQEYKDRG